MFSYSFQNIFQNLEVRVLSWECVQQFLYCALVFGVLNCKSLNSKRKKQLLPHLSALAISLVAALPILISLKTAIPPAPRWANPAQQTPSTQTQSRWKAQQAWGLFFVSLICLARLHSPVVMRSRSIIIFCFSVCFCYLCDCWATTVDKQCHDTPCVTLDYPMLLCFIHISCMTTFTSL